MSHGSDLVKRGRRPKHAQTRFSAHRSHEGGQSHGWVLGPRAMNINMQHISTSSPNMFRHVLSSFHGKCTLGPSFQNVLGRRAPQRFYKAPWQPRKSWEDPQGSDTHTHTTCPICRVVTFRLSFNKPCPCNSWKAPLAFGSSIDIRGTGWSSSHLDFQTTRRNSSSAPTFIPT